ncbi:MAG: hypothetical protein AVDCRST_MAG13-1614, partial [uncultured Solirubrobacteraceae bacterium]
EGGAPLRPGGPAGARGGRARGRGPRRGAGRVRVRDGREDAPPRPPDPRELSVPPGARDGRGAHGHGRARARRRLRGVRDLRALRGGPGTALPGDDVGARRVRRAHRGARRGAPRDPPGPAVRRGGDGRAARRGGARARPHPRGRGRRRP